MFNQLEGLVINKAISLIGKCIDLRSQILEDGVYRDYVSRAEALANLTGTSGPHTEAIRSGHFPVYITPIDGDTVVWWFLNGTTDADLVEMFPSVAFRALTVIAGTPDTAAWDWRLGAHATLALVEDTHLSITGVPDGSQGILKVSIAVAGPVLTLQGSHKQMTDQANETFEIGVRGGVPATGTWICMVLVAGDICYWDIKDVTDMVASEEPSGFRIFSPEFAGQFS